MIATPSRIVVTGTEGQVARALLRRAAESGIELVAVGRPDLDLARPETIGPALRRAAPAIVINAAAYTAVDQAETEPEMAQHINADGAGAVAAAAAAIGAPVIQLSTDYVFDGSLDRPYTESDPVSPLGAYGRSKLAGERAVAAANTDHVILRTAWVYSPYGKNFVKAMLRLAGDRDEVAVVADQRGSPTSALDIADGVLVICRNLLNRRDPALRGVFHMVGGGEATWADLATTVFEVSGRLGGPTARVRPITTAEYPTPARRPADSRLNCRRLAAAHGLALPDWRRSVERCVAELVGGRHPREGHS